jgi:hypothetical protein
MSDTIHGYYIDLTILYNGNLLFQLTPEGREELSPGGVEDSGDTHFIDMLEDYLANGWELIYPEEVGALWGGLIITNDCVRDDEGNLYHVGRVWAYDHYAVRGYIEPLLEDGEMEWRKYD